MEKNMEKEMETGCHFTVIMENVPSCSAAIDLKAVKCSRKQFLSYQGNCPLPWPTPLFRAVPASSAMVIKVYTLSDL